LETCPADFIFMSALAGFHLMLASKENRFCKLFTFLSPAPESRSTDFPLAQRPFGRFHSGSDVSGTNILLQECYANSPGCHRIPPNLPADFISMSYPCGLVMETLTSKEINFCKPLPFIARFRRTDLLTFSPFVITLAD